MQNSQLNHVCFEWNFAWRRWSNPSDLSRYLVIWIPACWGIKAMKLVRGSNVTHCIYWLGMAWVARRWSGPSLEEEQIQNDQAEKNDPKEVVWPFTWMGKRWSDPSVVQNITATHGQGSAKRCNWGGWAGRPRYHLGVERICFQPGVSWCFFYASILPKVCLDCHGIRAICSVLLFCIFEPVLS